MKFKYFLRGFGIGIVFASIIFLVVYSNNIPSRVSDADVIRRAKQLGMVEADDPITQLIDKDKKDDSNSNSSDETSTENISTENSTDVTSEDDNSSKKDKSSEKITDKTSENNNQENTEQSTENNNSESDKKDEKKSDKNKDKETVEITIGKGSSSFPVCQKLEELGMIDNAAKFDDYLIDNGYADRISVGTHKLTKGMDYHEIAELISDPLED